MKKLGKFKSNKKALGAIGAAVIIIILLVCSFFAYEDLTGAFNQKAPASSTKTSTGSTSTNSALPSPEPIQFTLTDPVAGGAIGSATLTLYNMQNQKLETLTTGSNGVVDSAQFYLPGQQLFVQISDTNYIPRTVVFTVPSVASAGAYNAPVYGVSLQTFKEGTFAVTAGVAGSTTVYTSGQTLNFTTLGVTSLTLTFTITNTGAINTGWWSSYDQYNGVNQNCALVLYTTGSSVSVLGATQISRGTTTYWSSVLPDGYPPNAGQTNQAGLTKMSGPNNTMIVSGQCTVSITVNKAALAHGSTQTLSFALYAPFDQTYFGNNGVGGPNSATLTSGSFTLAA